MGDNKIPKKREIPKLIYWVIVILGTSFIFFTSFTLGQKIAEWKNSDLKNNGRKMTISDDKVKILIDEYKAIFQHIKWEGLNENIKLNIVFNQLKSNEKPDSIYTCEEAFEDAKENEHRADNPIYVCDNTNVDGHVSSYKYDIVNQYYKKLYGENEKLEKKDYDGNNYYGEYFEYSKNLDIYVELLRKYGSFNALESYNYYEIENKKYEDGKLEVEIAYLPYTSSYNEVDSESKKVFTYEINGEKKTSENEDEIINIYKENKKRLPRLTFYFEKENNDFILKSIK